MVLFARAPWPIPCFCQRILQADLASTGGIVLQGTVTVGIGPELPGVWGDFIVIAQSSGSVGTSASTTDMAYPSGLRHPLIGLNGCADGARIRRCLKDMHRHL